MKPINTLSQIPDSRINALLRQTTASPQSDMSTTGNTTSWLDKLKHLDTQLSNIDHTAQHLAGKLPSDMSKLLQLQMRINQAQVDTQLAVKIADAISGCIKRVQQMGSGG